MSKARQTAPSRERRAVIRWLCALLPTGALVDGRAQEAGFPTKPIRMVVSTVPGTVIDIAARLYADRMSRHLKQPIVVENVAGASSLLAVRQVLRSAPDGYTVLVSANTLVAIPHINFKAGYAVKELMGVGEMVRSPMLMVTRAADSFRTLPDLLSHARRNPGTVTFGSSGIGSTNHLAVTLLAQQAGVQFLHVPYKGISAAVPDVAAGRVSFLMGTPTSVIELLKTGALRALAISSESRSPQFPELPTLKEIGYASATFEVWVGMTARAGIPQSIRVRLGEAMEVARSDPELVAHLAAQGQQISSVRTPDQFDAELRRDDERLGRLVKEAGIVAE